MRRSQDLAWPTPSDQGRAGQSGDGAPARTPRIVAARYQLLNEIGTGGMGLVYRVLDRLTGRVVTLKRLRVPSPRAGDGRVESPSGGRLALAQEFRLLASLRHPNIISVLDYGFDEDREPYFTMDLEEGARTIIEAGAREPLAVQVELLVQTLRALAYLHRHGIVHRDVKPENILVVRDQVKVVDFGLSTKAGATDGEEDFAGTLAYMAPEVLDGALATPRADLYALGLIAYQLVIGEYPYPEGDQLGLYRAITSTSLPRPDDDLDPRLRPILARLLAKQAEERYGDASEVIAAFATALELPLQVETPATRESFLQAAPLIGRSEELATLAGALADAAQGTGSAWLVGGESGVGKSRLLEELRTRALVAGMVVVRGQGVSQGGGLYHVWRDVLSNLVLRIAPGDAEAGILKAVMPDIGIVLGREVPDPPEVDSEAASSRLLLAVESVLRAQPQPVLVVLEDLQWVGSESLKLFAWLAQAIERLPVMITGSFRDDEAPRLAETFRGVNVLQLRRLNGREIAALGEAMIGETAHQPALIALLERETEGIPFFIVEVVRTLAESAGRLAGVGSAGLPGRVASGGMRKVIRRALKRVPPDAMAALETAAVIGRSLDPLLIGRLHPELGVDDWLDGCAAAAVLDLRDAQWRFAHDKLREQLLEDLPAASRRTLHRRVAEAIEERYPGRLEYVTSLAHHWREAGDAEREATYAHRAGVLAVQSGACQEAVTHLTRTLELLRMTSAEPAGTPLVRPAPPFWRRRAWLDPNAGVDADGSAFRLGTVEGALTEAYFRLGDLQACGEHARRALVYFGQHVPSGRLGWLASTARQGVLRALQSLSEMPPSDDPRTDRVASEIARVELRLVESFFYSLRAVPAIWSALRVVNHCVPAGPSPNLAHGYIVLGLLAAVLPAPRLAGRLCRIALDIAEQTGSRRDVAWILSRTAVFQLGVCDWDGALSGLGRATRIAEDEGDIRLSEEVRQQLGVVELYCGRFEGALAHFRETHDSSRRSGNQQVECWALLSQADAHLRLGRTIEALALYDEALPKLDDDAMRSEAVWGFGMSALARLRAGNADAAFEGADRALAYVLRTQPVAYWTQHGSAAIAEVFLLLLERGWAADPVLHAKLAARASQACVALGRYARRFPLGRPHARLWQGLHAWLSGRPRRAMRLWRATIDLADATGTPYERARAHLEIGRHLSRGEGERRRHLDQAAKLFERLACPVELEWTRAELAQGPAA